MWEALLSIASCDDATKKLESRKNLASSFDLTCKIYSLN